MIIRFRNGTTDICLTLQSKTQLLSCRYLFPEAMRSSMYVPCRINSFQFQSAGLKIYNRSACI